MPYCCCCCRLLLLLLRQESHSSSRHAAAAALGRPSESRIGRLPPSCGAAGGGARARAARAVERVRELRTRRIAYDAMIMMRTIFAMIVIIVMMIMSVVFAHGLPRASSAREAKASEEGQEGAAEGWDGAFAISMVQWRVSESELPAVNVQSPCSLTNSCPSFERCSSFRTGQDWFARSSWEAVQRLSGEGCSVMAAIDMISCMGTESATTSSSVLAKSTAFLVQETQRDCQVLKNRLKSEHLQ